MDDEDAAALDAFEKFLVGPHVRTSKEWVGVAADGTVSVTTEIVPKMTATQAI
jgi:hypothetical protein